MDMLDPGLDPAASATAAAAASHDKGPEAEEGVELQEGGDGPGAEEQTAVAIASVQQAAFGDHNIQYQFRTENNGGQVTYRVVQVTDGQLDGQGDTAGAVSVVSTAAFAGGQQAVTQAVIQNPFSNGGSPAAEAVSGEARFAYFPASSVGDTTAVSVQTTDQSLQAGGQFYVMMTPQDVLQTGTQRTIAPRTHPYSPKIDGTRTPRDERRRAQHNEVERRRRDKINNWIVQLSKIIPDCNADNSKTGASKGGILSKACDYIRELRQTNQRMQETFKEAERLQMDNELLRQQPPLSPGTSSGLAWRQEGGGQSPCHTPLPPWTLEQDSRTDSTMALNRQTWATCLLLLLLASLTSGAVLPPQTRQLADLQTQDTAGAAAGLMVRSPGIPFRASPAFPCLPPAHCPSFPQPVLQRPRRDTHFPICVFCCGCCHKARCGMCCRT
ncbi:upstream stimulatory factor 2 isoform X3 [Hippopotamus amphibius kiboko]|uniref:upstream stimulatory factor 2 isoform X3 n=1 Tax=Hippopotamus amphibius kiboko TaxID=575201 RepID=UPI00259958EA|nr:upstream stimulatory factor 2 isoform X3 [Hippopotamus amphibius kiboko]